LVGFYWDYSDLMDIKYINWILMRLIKMI
jgi:hypothetical protein